MSFRVGQKVVCVRAFTGRTVKLVEGRVYTISALDFSDPRGAGVRVYEVKPPNPDGYFWASRFRPITERSTDTGMAILRQILADHKTPVREKV